MSEITASRENKVVRTNSSEQIQPQANTIKSLLTSLTFLAGLIVVVAVGYFLIEILLFTFTEMLLYMAPVAFLLLIIMPILVWSSVVLVPFNTILILQRLGSKIKVKEAGVRIRIPFIDEIFSKEDLRLQENLIETNEALTKKGTTVNVTAVLFWQLLPEDPARFVQEVQNPSEYMQRIAEAAIRRLISTQSIEELQEIDEADTKDMNEFLSKEVGTWAKSKIEITDIQLPEDIKNALAQVEKADQEAKAEIIRAEVKQQVMNLLFKAVEEKMPEGTSQEIIWSEAMHLITLDTIKVAGNVISFADILGLMGSKNISS